MTEREQLAHVAHEAMEVFLNAIENVDLNKVKQVTVTYAIDGRVISTSRFKHVAPGKGNRSYPEPN